jgi:hypothetical protein
MLFAMILYSRPFVFIRGSLIFPGCGYVAMVTSAFFSIPLASVFSIPGDGVSRRPVIFGWISPVFIRYSAWLGIGESSGGLDLLPRLSSDTTLSAPHGEKNKAVCFFFRDFPNGWKPEIACKRIHGRRRWLGHQENI